MHDYKEELKERVRDYIYATRTPRGLAAELDDADELAEALAGELTYSAITESKDEAGAAARLQGNFYLLDDAADEEGADAVGAREAGASACEEVIYNFLLPYAIREAVNDFII